VQANASMKKMKPRFYVQAKEHVMKASEEQRNGKVRYGHEEAVFQSIAAKEVAFQTILFIL
jgi:hypothetical protein